MRIGKGGLAVLSVVLAGGAFLAAVEGGRGCRAGRDAPTAAVRRGDVVESVYGIGTVASARSWQLKSGVTNTVRDLFVREGDRVRRDAPLADLGGVVMKAPFAGTVTRVPVKVGETVFPQTAVLSLVDLTDRYAVVALEQRAAVNVRRGQKARLSFEGLRQTPADGAVESVYSNEGAFLVRIRTPDLPPEILPDMTADVAILIGEKKGVLLAPAAAVSGGKVRVARGGRAPVAVAVETGLVDAETIEIRGGGLREGDRLVLPRGAKP